MDQVVDIARLAAWMDAQGLGSGAITDAARLAGGTQNILLRFTRAGRDYVLRRPPQHLRAKSNEVMRREAQLLAGLAGTAVPHPALIAACGDESVIGAVFYLMEPVDGFNPMNGLPESHQAAAVQHRMGLALVEGMAALHDVDHRAAGLADFGKADGFLERQVARWRAELEGYGALEGWPGASALGDVSGVADWLEANRPASFIPGILHGDFHLANMMFRNDSPELAAIVDWEMATIGDPLIDLGWLLASWPHGDEAGLLEIGPWNGFPTPAELVAHYAAHASRGVDDLDWYGVFACYKLGIVLEGTFARASAGKAPIDIGARLHDRAQWLFSRAHRWIAGGVISKGD